MPGHAKAIMEELDERECRRLVSLGVIGRIAYVGRYDLTVLPDNYRFVDGDILFRTAQDSLTGEDLRTGIAHADYKVAFEIDHFDESTPGGLERSRPGSRPPCGLRGRAGRGRGCGCTPVAQRGKRSLHPHHAGPDHRAACPPAGLSHLARPETWRSQ
jgi:Pyridoxamine 5'-phosphate oxidase